MTGALVNVFSRIERFWGARGDSKRRAAPE